MVQRREGRALVVKALYSIEISGNDSEVVFGSIIKPKIGSGEKNFEFVRKLFTTVLDNRAQLDKIIQKHIKNWEIERLATLDRVILQMALCEFLYFEQVPTKVTINEAIEIAKDYSTEKSGNFINGILDASLADLQDQGEIQKSGRGLINSSIN